MGLQEYIDSLPKDKQFNLAIMLAKLMLPIWEEYAERNTTTYKDTVVGLTHSVNKNLLRSTVCSIEKYIAANPLLKTIIKNTQLKILKSEFGDPIVALKDFDWELPYEVQTAFYSAHNLLDAALGKERTVFDEPTIYVAINQAIDALESSKSLTMDEIRALL
jgi:hypothetical protein